MRLLFLLLLLLLPLTTHPFVSILQPHLQPHQAPLNSHSIESTTNPILGSTKHTLTLPVGDDTYTLMTGGIGRQASAALTFTCGDNYLYTTACCARTPKPGCDFIPLSVEHQARFSSVGQTSGGYNKRDGRPSENEILTCRLIDRPLRPLIHPMWRHDTQLLSWVMSYDGEMSTDVMAINAASAALYLSDVPLSQPIGAVEIGLDPATEEFILNPTKKQKLASPLHLTVAGTATSILMIEGAAEFIPEAQMLDAIALAQTHITAITTAIIDFAKVAGKATKLEPSDPPGASLVAATEELMSAAVDEAYAAPDKSTQSMLIDAAYLKVSEELGEEAKGPLKTLFSRKMYEMASLHSKRVDGRAIEQIRPIDIQMDVLPRVHGSAVFTRGETQSFATATLGDKGMQLKVDTVDGAQTKKFYLQYTFPPSCVGETGRTGSPGRREIGHGNLAERALIPIIPDETAFPYSIRVESLITESHGSSSMASVCGGCLAMMSAGVPIKSVVAGIAMGALMPPESNNIEDSIVLTDLMGIEDALGAMDFKVAGNREGISTFQLDTKTDGLTVEFMRKALEQAKKGRFHILDQMELLGGGMRDAMPDTVPKIRSFSVPPASIGKVIGPGGKQIRALIEDYELTNCDVAEDGTVQITGFNTTRLEETETFVLALIEGGGGRGRKPREPRVEYDGPTPVIGEKYRGKLTGVHSWGCFMEFMPGLEGLVHVSELATERVRNCEGFVSSLGEEFDVVYLGVDDRGKQKLSRKRLFEKKQGRGNPHPGEAQEVLATAVMSEEEQDVIARAISTASD